MSADIKRFLTKNRLFSMLPEEELHRLAAAAQRRVLQRGERVYSEGEKAHVTWVVESGQLKITKSSIDGKPLTIEMIMPGEIFGCVSCVESGFYPCEALADAPTSVVSLPIPLFLSVLEKNAKFARAIYMEMGRRVREAQSMRTLSMEPMEKRIVGALLWLWGKFGNVLPFTRQAVAEMANTTEESAIRTLIQFRKKGLIRTARKKIILVKPEALRALLEQS